MNTFQVETFVSQGCIVVAIDQLYAAALVVFPDGREMGALPLRQMIPLIQQSHSPAATAPTLNGRTFESGIVPYLAQAGTFGVSLGGIVGAVACRVEPRLQACLFMDAPMPVDVVKFSLQRPALWITRDAETMRPERRRSGGWTEADISAHQTSMRTTYASSQHPSYFVQIPGMFHVNLTDVPYWSPLLQWVGITGPIDAQRAHNINAYSLAFFNRHLLNRPEALLDSTACPYPEVVFNARQP